MKFKYFLCVVVVLSIFMCNSAIASEIINVTFEYYGPAWDINHDGGADYLDVSALSSVYGSSGIPGWTRADIIPDGIIDYLDVSALSSNYGTTWIVT